LTDAQLQTALQPITWFLNRAADGGIPLTAAGYLKPADVQAVAELLPTMNGWIGRANREIETTPVLYFRKLLQALGLLRKHKDTLRTTRVAAAAQDSPQELWDPLAEKLAPESGAFDTDATLLLILYAATSPDADLPLNTIAEALTELGWRTDGHQPIEGHDLYSLPAVELLSNISSEHADERSHRSHISVAAATLAHAALRRPRQRK
jgi:hypothetical protein